MNRTKIEWTDWSLNPIVGCLHRCPYCYARKQAYRFRQRCSKCYDFIPHPHLERLEELNPYQRPKRIFIDSMWDWNSEGVEIDWLNTILKKMAQCHQHIFQILSKRPERYKRFNFPENVWLGTSVTRTRDCGRVNDLIDFKSGNLKFVSVEPIHESIDFSFSKESIGWIIIGAETGNRIGKIRPEKEWVESILGNAKIEGIPVFVKDNIPWERKIREFPNERRREEWESTKYQTQ